MKKFLIVIAILFSYLIAKELFDNRPFKFEEYKNNSQLDAALIKQFPLGSDIREMMKLFEQSGGHCEERLKSTLKTREFDKYDVVYWCEYESGWITLHPLLVYEIWFMGDKNYKLRYIFGSRYPGLVI